jgi:ATP-dependent Lhr-like helicase
VLPYPPDPLLITPESLDAMLIGTRVDRRAMFGNLRAVVARGAFGGGRGWTNARTPAWLPRFGESRT